MIRTEYEFRGLVIPLGTVLDFSHSVILDGATLRFVECRVEGAIDLRHVDVRGALEFVDMALPWVDGRPIAIDLREARLSGDLRFAGLRSARAVKSREVVVDMSSILIDRIVGEAGAGSKAEEGIRFGRIAIAGKIDGNIVLLGRGLVSYSDVPFVLRGTTWRAARLELGISEGIHPRTIDASSLTVESATINVAIGQRVSAAEVGSTFDLSGLVGERCGIRADGLSVERVDARDLRLARARVTLSGFGSPTNSERAMFVGIAVSEWMQSRIDMGGDQDPAPWRLSDNDLIVRLDVPLEKNRSSEFTTVVDEQGDGRVQFALNDEQVLDVDDGAHWAGRAVREGTVVRWNIAG